ncbi:single-strand DNA-binding protein [Pedococcus cremeus]|uniref:Single-strand DNA-binding protein n=1 Tax=Pedococcus cremeus TaxID=587636 RepID=A0A1H9TZF0_9MICO|nr:single-stranded DNA-binding protein [Pedococcus cremeus]SES02173.1 single-strand DNA-binding protein [Pedococcus cremeus]
MGAEAATDTDAATAQDAVAWVNEVHLSGRVSGTPQEKTLPSGDAVVLFRLVVRRPAARRTGSARAGDKVASAQDAATKGAATKGAATKGAATRGAVVDTLDVACWTARSRKVALRLQDGDAAEVTGSLHRRFFRAGGAAASRYEVAAATVIGGRR